MPFFVLQGEGEAQVSEIGEDWKYALVMCDGRPESVIDAEAQRFEGAGTPPAGE